MTNNLKIGGDNVAGIFMGATEIQKVYLGSTLVYEKVTPSPSGDVIIRRLQGNVLIDEVGVSFSTPVRIKSSSDSDGISVVGLEVFSTINFYVYEGPAEGTPVILSAIGDSTTITDAGSGNVYIVTKTENNVVTVNQTQG